MPDIGDYDLYGEYSDASKSSTDSVHNFDSDSESGEGFVDPTPPSKGKEAADTVTFSVFDTETLRHEIDARIAALSINLGVDQDLALVLLLHHDWKFDFIMRRYPSEHPRIYTALGEPEDEGSISDAPSTGSGRPRKRAKPEIQCGVCFDDIKIEDTPDIRCGHMFCRDCWSHHLSTKILDEAQCRIRCMHPGCKATLTRSFLQNVIEDKLLDRWLVLIDESFVTKSSDFKFCSAPSCTQTIQCGVDKYDTLTDVPTVKCQKGHIFCFACGTTGGHHPVVCKIVKQWVDYKGSGDMEWIHANTRPCPQCKSSIEKAGGCNRILCRNCQFQFCWVCLRNWNVHGYNQNVCNSYNEPPPTQEMNAARVKLERWGFYYSRFENHEKSSQLDQNLVGKITEKVEEMQKDSKLTWIETRFLQEAVDKLTECRELLKWTYAMAFFLATGNKKETFELIQQDLEDAVEKLSELIAAPMDDATDLKQARQEMLNNFVYVNTRHRVLVRDITEGLSSARWEFIEGMDIYE